MSKDDERVMAQRHHLNSRLRQLETFAQSTLQSRSSLNRWDLEAARVFRLARITGGQEPRVPPSGLSFESSGRVDSIADLDQLTEGLLAEIDRLVADPERFGVQVVTDDNSHRVVGQVRGNPDQE